LVTSNEGRAYELNEVSWWSLWADATWLNDDAYVLLSREFDEEFFNRAGFVKVPTDAEQSLELIEKEFGRRGRAPSIFVRQDRNHPRLLRALAEKGYKIVDQMAVMEVEAPSFAVNPGVELELGPTSGEDWAATYLTAFYGEKSQLKTVMGVLEGVSKSKEASLVLARLNGEPAGCLALFRSDRVCGVYCVGTRPEFRKMNVASTMLDLSRRMAASEGRRLILQTILSDSLESFYVKLGFSRLYLKDVFVADVGRAAR
jgi:N-acetylglutamate synthase-like GNAT family acetyltransferase